jgi:hypothetical protein
MTVKDIKENDQFVYRQLLRVKNETQTNNIWWNLPTAARTPPTELPKPAIVPLTTLFGREQSRADMFGGFIFSSPSKPLLPSGLAFGLGSDAISGSI